MGKQRRYDRQFKLSAARLVVEQGYSCNEAAERLGASAWSIRQWVNKFRESGDLAPAEQSRSAADDVRQLRKEVRQLKLENEILKKAAAYFAKESL